MYSAFWLKDKNEKSLKTKHLGWALGPSTSGCNGSAVLTQPETLDTATQSDTHQLWETWAEKESNFALHKLDFNMETKHRKKKKTSFTLILCHVIPSNREFLCELSLKPKAGLPGRQTAHSRAGYMHVCNKQCRAGPGSARSCTALGQHSTNCPMFQRLSLTHSFQSSHKQL